MEHGSIERELHIDASPEVVFTVISSPEYIKQWWDSDADLDPRAGAVGTLTWHDSDSDRVERTEITVVECDPPRTFSFRWVYAGGEVAAPGNSLLVTFDLEPSGAGTTLRFVETGFRVRGWEAAVLEQQYQEHVSGWDTFLPRLAACANRLVASR